MLILLFRLPAIFIFDLFWVETGRCQLALSFFPFFLFLIWHEVHQWRLKYALCIPSTCVKLQSLQCLCMSLTDLVFQMSSAEVSYMNKLTILCVCGIWVREKERREQGRQFEFSFSVLNIDGKECYLPSLRRKWYILELDQKNPLMTWNWEIDILAIAALSFWALLH